uniref:DUF2961 domain-containing protein n=1 Tax=candidate division WOR-3 bacterium TaxID=2052148 RepID=A0A7C4G9Q2_UNCW3
MRRVLVLSMAVLLVVLVAACSKQNIEKDKAAVRALVEADTTHFPAGTAGSGDSTLGVSPCDDTMVGIWWRGPQTHDSAPTIGVEVSGDSAWVSWQQHNYGELFHWVRTSDTTAERWVKTLKEKVRLNAIFVREGKQSDNDRGWRFRRLTLAFGQSDPTGSVLIDSVRIQSSLRSILIVDPLGTYFRLDSLISFTPGEQLTITLYTNATNGFAFLHAFWGWLFIRIPFESMGNGVFQGTWNAQLIPGFRFAIFDVLSRNTLLSKDAPYDFAGWLLPYAIKTAD